MKYKRKPDVQMNVDAKRFDGNNHVQIMAWRNEFPTPVPYEWTIYDEAIAIPYPSGQIHTAQPGDWIVRNEDGTFLIWSDFQFRRTFE